MIKNLNLYAAFLTVARCGSVSAAARELYVSQPGLSADIMRLENDLGVPLFFRTSRGMQLTDEGAACYEYVKKAFAYIDSGEDYLHDMAGLRAGRLRIGASDMTLRFFLLDYLVSFRDSFPDVRLSVTNAPTPKTLASLRDGLIDFAVVTEGAQDGFGDDVNTIAVRQVRDVFVCSPDFRADGVSFASKKSVSYTELAACPLVMLAGSTSATAYVAREVDRIEPGTHLSASIEPATSDLVLEFALRGMGIACIVEDFAAEAVKNGTAVMIDMKQPLPPRNMAIVYLREPPLCSAARKLIDIIANRGAN